MTDPNNDKSHGSEQIFGDSAPAEKNIDVQVIPSVGFLESTVSWIEQDSTTQPNQYLEDCNTRISGE